MEEIKNETNDNRTSRLVFDARYARALCHKNFVIKDIKPMRGKPDASIFIFDNTPEFQTVLTEIIAEYKAKDEAKKATKKDEDPDQSRIEIED